MMNLISVHHIRSYRLLIKWIYVSHNSPLKKAESTGDFRVSKGGPRSKKWTLFLSILILKKINHHSFIYGAEFVYNTVDSKGSAVDIRNQSPQQSADRYPASNWVSSAIFLQYHYTYSPKLMFQFGSRINSFFYMQILQDWRPFIRLIIQILIFDMQQLQEVRVWCTDLPKRGN